MKKIIAILLALMMVMAGTTFAMAAGGSGNGDGNDNGNGSGETGTSNGMTVELEKEYTVTGGTTFPSETLTFTSTVDSTNPTNQNVTIAPVTVTGTTTTVNLAITFPTYSDVGLYHYSITEDAGSTQGVTYDTTPIKLSVLVTYNSNNTPTVAGVGITRNTETGDKDDTISNEYDLGTLTVGKTVAGNAGDVNNPFNVTVTLTAATGKTVLSDITVAGGTAAANSQTITPSDWSNGTATANITIKHGETVTFSNIPAGVSYAVAEAAAHQAADSNGSNGNTGYTVSYTNETGTITKGATSAAQITNTKSIEIDTGVSMDSLPYMLLMMMAAFGIVLMGMRKRREY